jgi:hypothetical protein
MRYLLKYRFSWADLMGVWISVQVFYSSGIILGLFTMMSLVLLVTLLRDRYGEDND